MVAEWVAGRNGTRPEDLLPCVVGYAALGSTMASFERWVASEGEDLLGLLDTAFLALAEGFPPGAGR